MTIWFKSHLFSPRGAVIMQPGPSVVWEASATPSPGPLQPREARTQLHYWPTTNTQLRNVVWKTRHSQGSGHIWRPRMRHMAEGLAGPGLLTQGLRALLVSFPVHHGWVCDCQFAVVLLSDKWPPSPRHENSCDWGQKKSNRRLINSWSDRPEVSRLRRGKGKSSNTHLQCGHRLAVICVFQKWVMSLLLLSQTFFTC